MGLVNLNSHHQRNTVIFNHLIGRLSFKEIFLGMIPDLGELDVVREYVALLDELDREDVVGIKKRRRIS